MASRFNPGAFAKMWRLLTKRQRRASIGLGAMMLGGMLFETLGIGLVVPALALMTRSDLDAPGSRFAPILERLGNPSREDLVVWGMLGLFGIYTVKAIFLGFLAWKQSKFVRDIEFVCAQRLFEGYLHQPYTFHLQRNSSHLLRNATVLVAEFAQVLQQTLMLTAEVFVAAGVSALLIAVEPVGALVVVGVLGGAGWGMNKVVRNRILVWGRKREFHENLRMQHLQQGLNGIKDVRLSGREEAFLDAFSLHARESARINQLRVAFKAIPRLWLELLAVAGLVVLVLIMIGRGKPLDLLLPTLGLFAVAAFRLMPSVNRILDGLQSLRFILPVIDTLNEELASIDKAERPTDTGAMVFTEAIAFDGVSFGYPGTNREALQDVHLTFPRGSSVGFVGGSGAGKSTLVDVLIGLLAPTAGAVRIDGIDIATNLRGWQRLVGYVPQTIYLTDDTLRRNVAFGVPEEEIDDEAVRRAIRAAQIETYVDGLELGLETIVGERGVRLSGGQRQRVGIARALYRDPPVLVLDEATSALDIATETGIMEAVRALQGTKTIVIVAHRLTTIEHCDWVFRLEDGCLVDQGDAATVLSRIATGAPVSNGSIE